MWETHNATLVLPQMKRAKLLRPRVRLLPQPACALLLHSRYALMKILVYPLYKQACWYSTPA